MFFGFLYREYEMDVSVEIGNPLDYMILKTLHFLGYTIFITAHIYFYLHVINKAMVIYHT